MCTRPGRTFVTLGWRPGSYSINEDCSGGVQFIDAGNVMFKIYVEPQRGDTIWMIQTNPANNVFQGSAKRVAQGWRDDGQAAEPALSGVLAERASDERHARKVARLP